MALTDWDYRWPVELQDVPWDCAAASLTWCLNAAGHSWTEAEVVTGLGPTRISPALGLLDASGAGIVDWLGTIGITAENNPACTWADILGGAGHQPMLMGGRDWCHWTGVRLSSWTVGLQPAETVILANPAPGWMGVDQWMDAYQFEDLGTFSAVWFTSF
jgi:hypothetical protein